MHSANVRGAFGCGSSDSNRRVTLSPGSEFVVQRGETVETLLPRVSPVKTPRGKVLHRDLNLSSGQEWCSMTSHRVCNPTVRVQRMSTHKIYYDCPKTPFYR
jgi:hypothetical protein